MQRRQFMVMSGTGIAVGVAGCSGALDDGSVYDPDLDEENLVPMEPQEAWPDDDLYADHGWNEYFPAVFLNDDESLVVMFNAEIEETIEDAEEEFEGSQARYTETEEYTVGDESFIGEENGAAVCLFRHSNARGQSVAAQMTGADRNRAGRYAEHLFEFWEEELQE